MGRMYVAGVLLSITGRSEPANVAEVELEPIIPGAWAAWAKGPATAQTVGTGEAATTTSPVATKLAPADSRPSAPAAKSAGGPADPQRRRGGDLPSEGSTVPGGWSMEPRRI